MEPCDRMKGTLIYYGQLDGEINRIVISPYMEHITIECTDGIHYRFEDVTDEGDIYEDGQWIRGFTLDSDVNLIQFVYLMIQILEINEP